MTAQPHDEQLQRDLARFGAAVAKARADRGLTQEAAARDVLDMSRSFLADIERGERNVSIRTILRIARALDVSPGTLLDPLV